MAKPAEKTRKPVIRQESRSTHAAAPSFSIPRERLPLIVLFFTVTIGSVIVWHFTQPARGVQELRYRVVAEYPHDPEAFTQGLVYHDGKIYESTGLRGQSSIRRVDLQTGQIEAIHRLEDTLFGEGLTLFEDRLIQLTLDSNIAIVYDLELNELERIPYPNEGWGLTNDGTHLIATDGTARLYFLDPNTLRVERTVTVRMGHRPLMQLNEMQYVDGVIYANVWYHDFIYQIDPRDGRVLGRINLRDIYPPRRRPSRDAVMNGIAYNSDTGRLIITGKNWSRMFEIEVGRR